MQEPKGTGASSSGMSPDERARSLLVPTTDEAEGSVPRERLETQDQGDGGQGDYDTVSINYCVSLAYRSRPCDC